MEVLYRAIAWGTADARGPAFCAEPCLLPLMAGKALARESHGQREGGASTQLLSCPPAQAGHGGDAKQQSCPSEGKPQTSPNNAGVSSKGDAPTHPQHQHTRVQNRLNKAVLIKKSCFPISCCVIS